MPSLILAGLLFVTNAQAQGPAAASEADLKAHAAAVLASMVAKDFAKVEAQFDDKMKAALPPGRLAAGWDTLLTQAGGLKQCGTDVRVRLQGERDYQMSMDEFARWKAALSGRPNVAFHSYPALNHLFIAGTGKSVPAEYDQPSHVAEPVVVDIAAWITR